jgi:hypothetical protein
MRKGEVVGDSVEDEEELDPREEQVLARGR